MQKSCWNPKIIVCAALITLAAFCAPGLAAEKTPDASPPSGQTQEAADKTVYATPQEKYQAAFGAVRRDDYEKALPLFEELMAGCPEEHLRDLSYLWAAFIYEAQGLYNRATVTYFEFLKRTEILVYRAYANQSLYFLKERQTGKSFNYQWLPTQMLNKFFLEKASTSVQSFKFYLFNLAPAIMTVFRLVIFAAFWMLCLFMAKFEIFQRASFRHESVYSAWDFKDVMWLYVLFTLAQTIVFIPFHGSDFFMENIEKGLYVESILRMAMLAVMTLFFFMFKNMSLKEVLIGKFDKKLYLNLIFKYTGFIFIVTGLLGFVSRYELFGFERVSRVYHQPWSNLLMGAGLYKTVLVLFMAPLCEELFYRAVLLTGLAKHFRPAVAVFLCSLVFAAVHLNWQGFGIIFIMATFLCRAYLITGGILVSVAVHFLYNLVSLLEIVRYL